MTIIQQIKSLIQLFEFDKDFESKIKNVFITNTKYNENICAKLARDIVRFDINFIKTRDLELIVNHFNIDKLITEQVIINLKNNLSNLVNTELDTEFCYLISAYNQSNILAIPSKLVQGLLNIEQNENTNFDKFDNENKKSKSNSKIKSKNKKIKSKQKTSRKVNIEVDYEILNTKNSLEEFERFNMSGVEFASLKFKDFYKDYLEFCKLNKMFPQNILIFGKYFSKIYDSQKGLDGLYYLNVQLKK